MHPLLRRFREFGGFCLLWEYARMGILPLCLRQAVAVFLKRKKPMEAYGYILEQVGKRLKSKYEPVLKEIDSHSTKASGGKHSRYVWVCWLQG